MTTRKADNHASRDWVGIRLETPVTEEKVNSFPEYQCEEFELGDWLRATGFSPDCNVKDDPDFFKKLIKKLSR